MSGEIRRLLTRVGGIRSGRVREPGTSSGNCYSDESELSTDDHSVRLNCAGQGTQYGTDDGAFMSAKSPNLNSRVLHLISMSL